MLNSCAAAVCGDSGVGGGGIGVRSTGGVVSVDGVVQCEDLLPYLHIKKYE